MLLPLLFACSNSPELPQASSEMPTSTLAQAQAAPAFRLTAKTSEMALNLSSTNLPEGGLNGSRLVLDSKWRGDSKGKPNAWRHDSPVKLGRKRYAAAPEGLSLEHEGNALSFGKRGASSKAPRWSISEDGVWVYSKKSPSTWAQKPVLVSQREEALQKRLNHHSSGLSAQEHVLYELTLGAVTRSGLLLSAPGSMSLETTLPNAAMLSLHSAIVPRTVRGSQKSDGAAFIVEVNGQEIARADVANDTSFEKHSVDLSEFGGQTVTLTLRSEVTGKAEFDHVFLGSPKILGKPEAAPRRVIFIGLDTLRYASMSQHGYSRDTTTPLDPFASSTVIFENAYTPAPRTRPSFRSALTGRQPLPAMEATGIGERFHQLGFHTAGVTANVHLVPRFGFNKGFDYWHYENGANADVQISRAKEWLSSTANEDSFLFLHFMDPHTFYRAPGLFANRYVETSPGPLDADMNRWRVAQLDKSVSLNEDNKAWLQARYDGEVRYLAEEMAAFLSWTLALPGQTLILMHSDHGEEFWEHGGYEHNHTLYQELVHAVLWIRPPGGWADGPHRVSEPTALVDIVPTLIDLFQMDTTGTTSTDGISLAPFLDAGRQTDLEPLKTKLEARALPIGHLMYDKERWATVQGGHKYILETVSGQEELYDIANDPREQRQLTPLYSEDQLDGWRAALQTATGWPVGPGWRVHIKRTKEPFTLRFEEPVDALILDPEAGRTRRANLEWGERSATTPEDVGQLQRSEDGKAITFTPGPKARKGILAIRFSDSGASGVLSTLKSEEIVPAQGGRITVGELDLDIKPGTVILPQDSVRIRMAAQEAPETEASDAALEALQALGYVE